MALSIVAGNQQSHGGQVVGQVLLTELDKRQRGEGDRRGSLLRRRGSFFVSEEMVGELAAGDLLEVCRDALQSTWGHRVLEQRQLGSVSFELVDLTVLELQC